MDAKTKRKFTGKLSDFISKEEKAFCKAQLKAYLKGWTQFTYGRNKITGHPMVHMTPQKFE